MTFVVFATPAFDGTVTLGYLTSMMRTTRVLDERGIKWEHATIGGDPYLAKVRNALVSAALQQFPDMTDLFFLDADLDWDPQAVLKLLDHPSEVAAAIYPKKMDAPDFPCELVYEGAEIVDGKPVGGSMVEKDGWYKARKVPTGFLRIKRQVLEAMASVSGRYKDGTNGGALCWNIFEMGYSPDKEAVDGLGEWWGEDYAWCEKYVRGGGEIWVWPDAEFGHRGPKTWRNNLLPFVQNAAAGRNLKLVKYGGHGEADQSFPVAAE